MVFDVRCPDPELAAYLDHLLAGLPTVDCEAPVLFEVSGVPERGFRSVGQAIETLISNINLGAIDAAEGNLLLHAGAVCGPGGEVAVICGPSGSGKSTLTARLVESGLTYLTDEVTCIDPDTLLITPLRKPVSLKPGSHRAFAHLEDGFDSAAWRFTDELWLIPATQLGGAPLPALPLLPQVLVFPTFVADERLTLEPLSAGEAALRVGANSSRLRGVRGGPLPALARLVEQAPAYRIVYSDLPAAADQIRQLLAA